MIVYVMRRLTDVSEAGTSDGRGTGSIAVSAEHGQRSTATVPCAPLCEPVIGRETTDLRAKHFHFESGHEQVQCNCPAAGAVSQSLESGRVTIAMDQYAERGKVQHLYIPIRLRYSCRDRGLTISLVLIQTCNVRVPGGMLGSASSWPLSSKAQMRRDGHCYSGRKSECLQAEAIILLRIAVHLPYCRVFGER